MKYTASQLAKLSKVSVRTLHWYDKIGLLSPAFIGSNGYRYYEENELLILQQILFFKELGFELKQIQRILTRSDFDKIASLLSHRKVLEDRVKHTKTLIKTIDDTVSHLRGTKKMKQQSLFSGFSKKKQAKYEKQIIERFGEKTMEESKKNRATWSKEDEENFKKEFDEICKELTKQIDCSCESVEVQELVRRHYNWIKKCWTPTKESYASHGQFIADSELRKAYERYHPKLADFMRDAIQIFSQTL